MASYQYTHFSIILSCRPEIFKTEMVDGSNETTTSQQVNETDESDDDDDDGLPPLEANTNRIRPPEFDEDTESNSDTDD